LLFLVFFQKFSKNEGKHWVAITDDAINIMDLFFSEMFQLHRVFKSIMSDLDVKFLGHFWKVFVREIRNKIVIFY
jgi:hypothetical protein